MFQYNVNDLLASQDALPYRAHPFDPTTGKHTICLSQHGGGGAGHPSTELVQSVVRLCRLPSGTQSLPIHAHTHSDEWIFVVSGGGGGARALICSEMDGLEAEERPIRDGDFLAFPAGLKDARALRAGAEDLVYIAGGSRSVGEVCVYPELQKVFFFDGTPNGGSSFLSEGRDVKWMKLKVEGSQKA